MKKLMRLLSQIGMTAFILMGAFKLFTLTEWADAQITTASMGNGQYATPFESPCITWQSSVTAETIVVGGAGQQTVPYYLSWLWISTGPQTGTNYITIKDTAAVSAGNAKVILPQIVYSSAPVSNTGSSSVSSFGPSIHMINFTPPIRISTGISITQGYQGGYVVGCGRSYKPASGPAGLNPQ